MQSLLVSLAALAAAAVAPAFAAKQVVYSFERAHAAGIDGALTVRHSDASGGGGAWLLASLDFSALELADVRAADPQCAQLAAAPEFQFHIHVDWRNDSRTSGAFAECARSATGNHYDPDFACGPSSEHVDTPKCEGRTTHYACSPARYAQDPRACEKGDLSGKVGNLVVAADGFASGEWKDPHFPPASDHHPRWSIVLHAVCGSATPRVACAVGVERDAPTTLAAGVEGESVYTGEYDTESYDWVDELRA